MGEKQVSAERVICMARSILLKAEGFATIYFDRLFIEGIAIYVALDFLTAYPAEESAL